MKPRAAILLALVLSTGGTTASMAASSAGVEGRVFGGSAALPGARVWAYQLSDLSLLRATADEAGQFAFSGLPAGLYRMIAHKIGYLPVVVMVTRASADSRQFVELQLAAAPDAAERTDFWSVREQIPADVLREMEMAAPLVSSVTKSGPSSASNFQTEFTAMTGVDQQPAADTYLSRGSVGLEGRMGAMRVGILGDFWSLDSNAFTDANQSLSQGTASSVSVRLENNQDSVHVTSLSNRMDIDEGNDDPVEMELYRVSWSRPLGSRGRSNVAAQYTTESNYYRWGLVNSAVLPDASRTLRVEGSYATTIGRSTLETGVRYRQREGDFVARRTSLADTVPEQTVSVFGRGSYEATPAMVLEYGLYTRLQDGVVSLTPRGGVVVQMGPRWQASASAAHRVDPETETGRPVVSFTPVFYGDGEVGELGEDYRYGLMVSRSLGDQGSVSLGAVDRKYGESMRLYFSRQFFDHLENVYLVPGDRLPELQFSLAQRLSPRIQTRLASSYADGGGGIVQATTKSGQYENDIRYMVTSLDTQFEPTATGIFLSLHRMEQRLDPLRPSRTRVSREVQLESLELAITQDLNTILNLASDWAIQLNMELSRGAVPDSPFTADDLRRRILGGVAVQF